MHGVDPTQRTTRRDVAPTGGAAPKPLASGDLGKALAEKSEVRAFAGKTPQGAPAEMVSFGAGRNRVNVWSEGGQVMAQRPNGPARPLEQGEVAALRKGLTAPQGGAYLPPNDAQNARRVRDFAAQLPQPLSGKEFRREVAGSDTPWVNTGTNDAGKSTDYLTMTPPGGGRALNVWKEGGKLMTSLGDGPSRQVTDAERGQLKTRVAAADRELAAKLAAGIPPRPPEPIDAGHPREPRLTPAQQKAQFEAHLADQRRALAAFARGL